MIYNLGKKWIPLCVKYSKTVEQSVIMRWAFTDKAMAMGVIQFAIGVFGNVPCPIVFGAAVDAACRARDVLCNVIGACVSYDNDSFRHFYLGMYHT